MYNSIDRLSTIDSSYPRSIAYVNLSSRPECNLRFGAHSQIAITSRLTSSFLMLAEPYLRHPNFAELANVVSKFLEAETSAW